MSLLEFTPANWNIPQTVTVIGSGGLVDDGDQNYQIQFEDIQSSDVQYNGLRIDSLDYVNFDDDTASIVISESSLQVDENGKSDEFEISLGSRPTSDVTIEFSVSDAGEAALSSNVVVFTRDNWDVPQTITVTGLNDDAPDGDTTFEIVATPSSSGDSTFDSLAPVTIDVTNDAALGPANTTTVEIVSSEENENEEEQDVIMPGIPNREMDDVNGADDVARKPRAIFSVDSNERESLDLDAPFVANQFFRSVVPVDHQIQHYSGGHASAEEFVNLTTRLQDESMHSLWGDLDEFDERVNEEAGLPQFAVGATATIASVFTAGYLVWVINSGWILAGVMSQMPMWNSFNVLAVLSKPDDEDEESNSLESLVNSPQPEPTQAPSGNAPTENATLAQVSS